MIGAALNLVDPAEVLLAGGLSAAGPVWEAALRAGVAATVSDGHCGAARRGITRTGRATCARACTATAGARNVLHRSAVGGTTFCGRVRITAAEREPGN